VEALVKRNLDPDLPVLRATGVPELSAFLRGELGRDEAVDRAKAVTRQYVKRQTTWARKLMADWHRAETAGVALSVFTALK
jgi:tRNA dimethylallyltransferase